MLGPGIVLLVGRDQVVRFLTEVLADTEWDGRVVLVILTLGGTGKRTDRLMLTDKSRRRGTAEGC